MEPKTLFLSKRFQINFTPNHFALPFSIWTEYFGDDIGTVAGFNILCVQFAFSPDYNEESQDDAD